MDVHGVLKANGIVPTIDAERAYSLGVEEGRSFEGELNDELLRNETALQDRVAYLEGILAEIGLQARRGRSR